MERAEILLEKLKTQLRDKAGRELLMLTFQQLYEEILKVPATGSVAVSGRVSVTLPGFTSLSVPPMPPPREEEKILETLQVDEAEIEAELEALKASAELINELSAKARISPLPEQEAAEDIPTLASHLPYLPQSFTPEPPRSTPVAGDTLNDRFPSAANPADPEGRGLEPSLNDRLRAAQKELADQLQEAPVRDIRKAIGINDRYLYINELFQGNEAMFERSLKTLNGFSILPEAEYWMQRELQVKLGWKEQDPLVLQFVQLIRRRFS